MNTSITVCAPNGDVWDGICVCVHVCMQVCEVCCGVCGMYGYVWFVYVCMWYMHLFMCVVRCAYVCMLGVGMACVCVRRFWVCEVWCSVYVSVCGMYGYV